MSKLPANAKKVFCGIIFNTYQWEQEQFDGTFKTFEAVERPDTVVVIPIVDNKIIILDEEQPGGIKRLNFPTGRLDLDEEPKVAALRELHEETGITPLSIEPLDEEEPFSKIKWKLYFYIARGIKNSEELHLDPGEKIRINYMDFDAFYEKVIDMQIEVPKLILKLCLKGQKESVREIFFGN